MRLTFVLKEDFLEVACVIACLLLGFLAWNSNNPITLLAIPFFGILTSYFYARKNKARWCSNCDLLMSYGTELSSKNKNYEVVYECKKCGKRNRTGIYTEYKAK